MRLLVSLVVGVLDLLPSGNPPSWFVNAGATWSSLMGQVSGLSHWIPLALGVQVVTAILSCAVIGFTIKVVRLVLSYFTAGGGSAG